MGNNQSQQTPPPPTEVVRRPPTRPNAPPLSRPISDLGPKGPSYHSPENLVLPKGIPMMRLRPVSMELSKFHPEYKEMFHHVDEDKENEVELDDETEAKLQNLSTSPPRPPPPILKNGTIPNGNVKPNMPVSNSVTIPNGNEGNGTGSGSINYTPAANTIGKANQPYRPSHRRQTSLGQDHNIIMEEPEENIDTRFKLDPLMQSFPGATGPSLPVKNNFNLDYSYQLTYVQLAEHRRNKTIEDLEKRTGKKLSDLSADLNENQDQPFKRSAPSRISSKSTGSGGSALSSKKKRAPAPPGEKGAPIAPPPPPVGGSNTLPLPSKSKVKVQNKQYSVDFEPPADYEMESPRRGVNVALPRYKAMNRSMSQNAVSTSPVSSPRKSAPVSRNNSLSLGKPEIILRKTPSVTQAHEEPNSADAEVPWLLQIRNMSESMSARRQQSLESSVTPDLPNEQSMETEDEKTIKESDIVKANINIPQKTTVFKSSNSELKADAIPNDVKFDTKIETKKEEFTFEKPASPKLARHASTLGFHQSPAPTLQRQISEPNSLSSVNQTDPMRRLSSLLQHDIKATANAKCHKLKKQVMPVPPKIKDPHEVFREQLAKACSQRDERVKVDGTIDDKLKQSDQQPAHLGKVRDIPNDRKDSTTSSEPPETLPKPPRYHKNVSINRNSSTFERRQNSNVEIRASTALDWTPEDDLDSDDNLSDREDVTAKKGASNGFKSTIIPNNMTELKSKKKNKKDKKPKISSEEENNRQKFGSVKKFKKSMHKSVKNAFGSISKASGKLLRKQRAEELEQVEDAPKNWKLSHSDVRSNRSKTPERAKVYMVPNGYGDTDSDSEHMNGEDHELFEVTSKQNRHIDTDDDTSEDDNYRSKANDSSTSAKRLTQREQKYKYDDSDTDMMVAKYKELKKKEMYKQSVKEELEKEREEATMRALNEARERERKLEGERRKQLEMELELHKIREVETRERLQRLENAHLQQQLSSQLLQQQQQHQQHISMQLSAPQLPQAGTLNQNFGLGHDASQGQAFTNLFGTQLPQNGYQTNFGAYHPTQTGSLLNSTVPSMPYDINDYMRMIGVQTPPTSQQMAYLLNSMTYTGQPFDRKSNSTLIEVINQPDPLKTFNSGHINYQLPEPVSKKQQGFQNWASAPNMNVLANTGTTSVPMSDFVASYSSLNGANSQSDKNKDSQHAKTRNPMYNSDSSDESLSPQRTVVRANVADFRKLPARTESGKFMRQYGNGNYVSKTNDSCKTSDQSGQLIGNKLIQENMDVNRENSVSPSNSTSTFDSAITSPSVSLSTPSSPSRSVGAPSSPMVGQRSDGSNGFRTILDLTSANCKTHITMVDGSNYNL